MKTTEEGEEIVELTSWDDRLAVSAMEHNYAKNFARLAKEEELVKKYSPDLASTVQDPQDLHGTLGLPYDKVAF